MLRPRGVFGGIESLEFGIESGQHAYPLQQEMRATYACGKYPKQSSALPLRLITNLNQKPCSPPSHLLDLLSTPTPPMYTLRGARLHIV